MVKRNILPFWFPQNSYETHNTNQKTKPPLELLISTNSWKRTILYPDRFHGWACFVGSIAAIGGCTALLGDLASAFGCVIGVKDSVTAISIVALGTSVPGTSFPTSAAGLEFSNSNFQFKFSNSNFGI